MDLTAQGVTLHLLVFAGISAVPVITRGCDLRYVNVVEGCCKLLKQAWLDDRTRARRQALGSS